MKVADGISPQPGGAPQEPGRIPYRLPSNQETTMPDTSRLTETLDQLFAFLQDKLTPEDMNTVSAMFMNEDGYPHKGIGLGMDKRFNIAMDSFLRARVAQGLARTRAASAARFAKDFPHANRLAR